MRQRLSWDEKKVAEIEKKADPYTMNQDRQNPPVEKYQTGDPSAWAEDPNMATPWKTEGRNEVGLPAPAREAVVAVRKLEDKAFKCITIAQRMLPGADDSMLEEQATDLMFMPERAILATLQRQSGLAEKLAGKKDDDDDDEKEEKEAAKKVEKEEKEDKEAAKKEPEATPPAEKKPDAAPAAPVAPVEKKPEEVEAAKKAPEATPPAEKKPDTAPAPVAPVPEEKKEEKTAAPENPDDLELGKQSSDLLDQLFQDEPVEKTGAKKLSGIVKQASSAGTELKDLWELPPDISKTFPTR